jgi:hypothetical protein
MRRDIQLNDTQQSGTKLNYIQHNETQQNNSLQKCHHQNDIQ